MTEKRLIHGSYGEQRYLHSDEIFCKERNWNINLPSEREFKDGYCIITDRDNTAYSIDELVELLNEFQKENEKLKRIMGKSVIERLLDGFEESYKDLEKENEDLKKMLDNIANYMQKEHKEIPIDDFVEWWNNIARKGLE